MKKLASLLLTGALTFGLLAGCGSTSGNAETPAGGNETTPVESNTPSETGANLEGTVIKVGATPAPHAEILEAVKDLLAEQGITLEIVEFNDYIQPNLAVESGELDANYFQHITYMNEFNVSDSTHLVSAAEIHYEPFGLYAGKTEGGRRHHRHQGRHRREPQEPGHRGAGGQPDPLPPGRCGPGRDQRQLRH